MSSATASADATANGVIAADHCLHCGDALPACAAGTSADAATTREFCCTGCEAASQWIHAARLEDYYRLRSTGAGRVDAVAADLAAWDRNEIIGPHVRDTASGREIVLLTDGMRCAACAWLIDRALSREAGVVEVCANAVTGRIRLVWDAARPLSAILGRLQSLGYRPYLAGDARTEQAQRAEWRRWLLRVGVAGIGTLQAMMFAEALYLDPAQQMPLPTRDFFRWLTFLLATPVVFYAGYPFLAGAWRELTQRRAGMNVLVAGATLLAWGASTIETIRGGAQVWFDAAVMFVFLLLVARALETRIRQIATQRIDTLSRARPVLAQRERNGTLESVSIAQLCTGDVLRVAAGEHLPADGVLLDTAASFNEALLTGEARPVLRQPSAQVLAGSVCPDQSVRVQVTATGSATRLSALEQLVHRAAEQRPRAAALADRVAMWFVLGIALITAVVYLYWHATTPARAFEVALALLVISCPCALSLSVPAALAAAYSRLSELGVLVLRPDALQTLAHIDTVVFDKTGTLGDGRWQIIDTLALDDVDATRARQLAAALEQNSRHPIATAFAADASTPMATNVKLHAGCGVEGLIDGQRLRIGTAPFAAQHPDDGAVWLGRVDSHGQQALARFDLREQPRAEAGAALQQLRAADLRLELLSGDATAAAEQFAAQLHTPFERVIGRALPADKLLHIRELQAQRRCVAMVGDGINDAPVLAGADVSIALGEGAALAQQNADVVLLHSSLSRVADAIAIARRTRQTIRQNLTWALGYNLLALPVAALGYVKPWAAALAMVISSLTVTLNALRLKRAATTDATAS